MPQIQTSTKKALVIHQGWLYRPRPIRQDILRPHDPISSYLRWRTVAVCWVGKLSARSSEPSRELAGKALYTFEQTLLGTFHHNPTSICGPADAKYLLYCNGQEIGVTGYVWITKDQQHHLGQQGHMISQWDQITQTEARTRFSGAARGETGTPWCIT
ncbi:hypothetical protein GGR50DRAFT_679285 [Xylaria sp. CBS 124048]|nr:hypothetical protein GGR50DRAFT_679285 [Xylaria sp. CBS 124048]